MDFETGDLLYIFLNVPLTEIFPVFHVAVYIDNDHVFEYGVIKACRDNEWMELLTDPMKLEQKKCNYVTSFHSFKDYLSVHKLAFIRKFPKDKLRTKEDMITTGKAIMEIHPAYQVFDFNCEIAAINVSLKNPTEYVDKGQARMGKILFEKFKESPHKLPHGDPVNDYVYYLLELLSKIKFKIGTCYIFEKDNLESCAIRKVKAHELYPNMVESAKKCRQAIITSLIGDGEELFMVN